MPALTRAAALAALVVAALAVVGGAAYLAGSNQPSPVAPQTNGTSPAPSASRNPATDPTRFGLQVGPGVAAGGIIVFAIHEDATDSDQVYGLTPDGTEAWLLADAGSCCAVLAPDGRAVMTGRVVGGRSIPAIVKLPVQGSFEEAWTDFAPDLNLLPGAWSKEFAIAFRGSSAADPSKTGIYLSVANGGGLIRGNLVRLTSNSGTDADMPAAFSPDGTRLLFVRATPGSEDTGDLYVINVDGTGLRKLSPEDVGVSVSEVFGPGASWSSDGDRVAFAAAVRQGDAYGSVSRAYVVAVAQGDATAITPYGTYMTSARWSPDGAWIAYDADAGGKDLWLVRPDGTEAHRITHTDGSCCGTWSADSSLLLFEGNDADGAGLFIAHADGSGSSRLLTLATEFDARWRGWSYPVERAP
jgi:hypothetical protein